MRSDGAGGEARLNWGASPWVFEIALVGGTTWLAASAAWRIGATAAASDAAWLLCPALLLGYALADLASGVLHWFCDSFFDERTPALGPLLIAPFREHHRDPLGIVRHGPLELHANSCLAALPVLGACRLAPGPESGATALFWHAVITTVAVSAAVTNQFHRWAHDPSPPAVARLLQRFHLILTPERHGRHHRHPFAQSYCMTTGWTSALLDASGLTRRLERWLRGTTVDAKYGASQP